MKLNKKRKSDLMTWADESIRKVFGNGTISESFNGQIAAFSVSVALSGLKPTMAIYNSDSSNAEVDKKKIIKLLACMIDMDKDIEVEGADLYNKVINSDGAVENSLKKAIIEYAIALKLAIRTFKLSKS